MSDDTPRSGTWRCPHCGTPQAESARCWVCHRSSTCCGTCANYLASLVPGTGFCALDAKRRTVRSEDLRGCWTAGGDGLLTGSGAAGMLGGGAATVDGAPTTESGVPLVASRQAMRADAASARPVAAGRGRPAGVPKGWVEVRTTR